MASIDEVLTKLTDLSASVDAVKATDDAAIAKLAEIRALLAANTVDPAKLQAAADAIDALKAAVDVKTGELAAAVALPNS